MSIVLIFFFFFIIVGYSVHFPLITDILNHFFNRDISENCSYFPLIG